MNKDKIIENCQRRYYGSIAGIPDKIKPEEAYNQIMNGNIIIRLDDWKKILLQEKKISI